MPLVGRSSNYPVVDLRAFEHLRPMSECLATLATALARTTDSTMDAAAQPKHEGVDKRSISKSSPAHTQTKALTSIDASMLSRLRSLAPEAAASLLGVALEDVWDIPAEALQPSLQQPPAASSGRKVYEPLLIHAAR